MDDLRLSTIGEYREFGLALAEQRLDDARDALERCLQRSEVRGSPSTKSFLLQTLGDVLGDLGENTRGLESHRAGVAADPLSPGALLRLARYLAIRLGRYPEALTTCVDAHAKLGVPAAASQKAGWPRLRALVLALEARCHAAMGELSQARSKIVELTEMDELIAEHAVEACEILMRDESMRGPARTYLDKLVRSAELAGDELAGLRSKILQIIARA